MRTGHETELRTDGDESSGKPPLEIGLVIAGRMDDARMQAVETMRNRLAGRLQRDFDQFRWVLRIVNRSETRWRRPGSVRVEPTELLEIGQTERESYRWDFIIVITQSDLRTHDKPFAMGIVARVQDAAILSTSRLDPEGVSATARPQDRGDLLATRLLALALHALGHLNGLAHSDDPHNIMYEPATPADLNTMASWTAEQKEDVAANLRLIADVRLEEQVDVLRSSRLSFYLKGTWVNRHEIADAVLQAHPWEFPRRLARLTTAAFSTALILLMTAETWDLASSVSPGKLLILIVIALSVTTAFVTARQRLLVRRTPTSDGTDGRCECRSRSDCPERHDDDFFRTSGHVACVSGASVPYECRKNLGRLSPGAVDVRTFAGCCQLCRRVGACDWCVRGKFRRVQLLPACRFR